MSVMPTSGKIAVPKDGIASRLSNAGKSVEENSIFDNERQGLFKQIVEADGQDGVKGNIFASEITSSVLGDYKKAINGKPEDIARFMDKLMMLEAKDGKLDGSIFRNEINNKKGQAVQDESQKPIKQSLSNSLKNIVEKLLDLGQKDKGSVDNSSVDPSGEKSLNKDPQVGALKKSATAQNAQPNPQGSIPSSSTLSNNQVATPSSSTVIPTPAAQSVQSTGTAVKGTEAGKDLAGLAKLKQDGAENHCYNNVANAIDQKFGWKKFEVLNGDSAYMAADQLANNPKAKAVLTEVTVSKDQLPSLPAGAIVVWDKDAGHPDGHISVASGDGQEYSSKTRRQMTDYGTSFRVFMPKDAVTA